MMTRDATLKELVGSYRFLSSEIQRALQRRGSSLEQAEDLVSASFAIMLSLGEDELARISNQRAYLHGIARNLQVKSIADSQRQISTPDEGLDRAVDDPGFSRLETAQARELAVEAFGALSPNEQQLLWRSMVEQHSMRTIAKELETTVTNVTSQISRAKVALRVAYVAVLMLRTPPTCGFEVPDLARVAVGTASARLIRKYRAHADKCAECSQLLIAAQEELRGGVPLLAIVALGGVSGGYLAAPAESASASQTGSSSRARLLIGVVGFLLAVAWWTSATAVNVLDTESSIPISLGSLPSEAVSVDVQATPAVQTIPVPAPGEASTWETRIESTSSRGNYLFAAPRMLEEGYTTQPATMTYGFEWDGALVPVAVTNAGELQPVYLGVIDPGESAPAVGHIARDPTDTDQGATAVVEVVFLVSDSLPDGIGIGDRAPSRASFLAATGLDENRHGVTIALAVALVCGGLIVLTPRARGRRGGG